MTPVVVEEKRSPYILYIDSGDLIIPRITTKGFWDYYVIPMGNTGPQGNIIYYGWTGHNPYKMEYSLAEFLENGFKARSIHGEYIYERSELAGYPLCELHTKLSTMSSRRAIPYDGELEGGVISLKTAILEVIKEATSPTEVILEMKKAEILA